MADATTRLVIEAQTKGLAEATRDATRLQDSLGSVSKGAAASGRKMRDAIKEMSGELRRAQKDNLTLAAGFKVQSDAVLKLQTSYKELAAQIRKTRDEGKGAASDAAGDAEGQASGVRSRIASFFGRGSGSRPPGGEGGSGPPGSGAFGQGFLQGVLPEAFIQRGPGALRQAAGSLVGRTVRGVAGAGLELATSPFSGSQAAVNALSRVPLAGALTGGLQMSLAAAQAEAQTQRQFQGLMPAVRAPGDPNALESINALRQRTGRLGMAMGGLSANESAAFAAQMAAAGGGYASRLSGGTLAEAFAAQAGLGVDLGTSGVLARGDTLGATSGRGGSSTLAKAVADAVSLGLEGSEISKYVQSIAGSVEGFAQTGIKVDETSRGALGRIFESTGGYSAPRAAALASGVQGALSQIADSGPQGANQMLLLRAAGFDPADPDSYYRAQEKLDEGSPGERAAIFSRARSDALSGMKGLSQYGKAAAYRHFAADAGMNLRIGEARREVTSPVSTDRMRAALTPPDTAVAMANAITSAVGNTTTAGRAIGQMADMDSATGQKYVGSMLQMDQVARRTLNSLSTVGSKFVDLAAKIQAVGADVIGIATDKAGITQSMSSQ